MESKEAQSFVNSVNADAAKGQDATETSTFLAQAAVTSQTLTVPIAVKKF